MRKKISKRMTRDRASFKRLRSLISSKYNLSYRRHLSIMRKKWIKIMKKNKRKNK